ncbi:hypothetical protein [Rhizobium leguminosarum]|uniref:hypothetical protein n=1 Tax=Rhizobium leguminosarum TaxID=384 RepID=UPI0014429B4B|nr:hypothetical protein [Rhizobium leguminosarum]
MFPKSTGTPGAGETSARAAPEKPVPVPLIIGPAMGSPNAIPSVLDVKVTAND